LSHETEPPLSTRPSSGVIPEHWRTPGWPPLSLRSGSEAQPDRHRRLVARHARFARRTNAQRVLVGKLISQSLAVRDRPDGERRLDRSHRDTRSNLDWLPRRGTADARQVLRIALEMHCGTLPHRTAPRRVQGAYANTRPGDLRVPEHLRGSCEVNDVASVEALFATEELDWLGCPSAVDRRYRCAGVTAITEPALFA
jgi:hypothetical protein